MLWDRYQGLGRSRILIKKCLVEASRSEQYASLFVTASVDLCCCELGTLISDLDRCSGQLGQ